MSGEPIEEAEQQTMARKPRAALPDVFARPGQAPERNTAIEDLPKPEAPVQAPMQAPVQAGEPVAAPEPPPMPAVAVEPAPEPVAAPPAPPAAAPKPAPAMAAEPAPEPTSRPAPPPPAPPRPALPPRVQAAPARSGGQRTTLLLAAAAVVLAALVPMLEDPVLHRFGLATPTSHAQQEAALTLARQEQKLRDLDQRLAATTAQLAAARGELQQASRRGGDSAGWVRLLALGRVADALRGSAPFASDLAVAQAVGGGLEEFRAELAPVSGYAATGIPTLADLGRDFRRIADDTMRPRGILPTGLVQSLTGWNRWSRSTAPSDPTPELVQAAAARLAEGDVEEATARLRQVSGAYQPAFASWLEDAQARLAADALVRHIDRSLTAMARELPK